MSNPQKVVWITGGGTGIGKAVAIAYAQQGCAVAISGRRIERLTETVDAINAAGGQGYAVQCDVSIESENQKAVEQIVAQWGRLDIAIANAGFGVRGRIENLRSEDWLKQLNVNLIGATQTLRYALPELQKTGGRAALISSVMAYIRAEKHGAYSASKAAVTAIGETLSLELIGTGVSCTTIHPGYVESEIGQVSNDGQFSEELEDHRPQKLMWTAEDAARVMIDAIDARKRLFTFTWHGWFAQFMARHCPNLVYWAISRSARGRQRQIDIEKLPSK